MESNEPGKIAVVAGGGSGIGRGCALRLADMGYKTLLLGRTKEKLETVASEIVASGGEAEPYAVDVRDWDQLAELGTQLEETGIDLLINSAGGQTPVPSAEMSRETWDIVIDINLSGSFYLCRNHY